MRLLTVIAIALAVVAILGWMGWTLHASGALGALRGAGPGVVIVIVGGVVGTGLLTGVLMWLAFYSSRKGWDEPAKFEATPAKEAPVKPDSPPPG